MALIHIEQFNKGEKKRNTVHKRTAATLKSKGRFSRLLDSDSKELSLRFNKLKEIEGFSNRFITLI